MNNIPDFLYATIDVAIWSTCETGIGLAASAAACLRPLLRKVFGELSTHGRSSRKSSGAWGGKYPSRSRSAGYKSYPSNGDNDIPLTDHDQKMGNVNTISVGNTSPSGSTSSWKNWENKSTTESVVANKGGITKTVKITQL